MFSYVIYALVGGIWGWRSGEITALAFAKIVLVATGIVATLTALRAVVPPGLPPFIVTGLLLAIGAAFLAIAFGYLVGASAKRTRLKNDAADHGQT